MIPRLLPRAAFMLDSVLWFCWAIDAGSL